MSITHISTLNNYTYLLNSIIDIQSATLLRRRKKVSDDNVSGYRIQQVGDHLSIIITL